MTDDGDNLWVDLFGVFFWALALSWYAARQTGCAGWVVAVGAIAWCAWG